MSVVAGGGVGVPGRRPAVALLAAATALLVVGSLAVQLGDAAATQIGVGVGVTVVLGLLARLCSTRPVLAAATDPVLALTALSVFGWVSAAFTAVPAVGAWLGSAAAPVAFLAVNGVKLSSVAVLLVLARVRGWRRDELLLHRGDPAAPTGLPHLRWTVAGPVVVLLVLWLFLGDPAVLAAAGPLGVALPLVLAWLPVMLLGAGLNAAAEELLYRHGLIGTSRRLLGTGAAVAVSCLVFGLGHVTGSPGGWFGVVVTAVYGLVCATAMLQTRGAVWNWVIHLFGDLGVVTALLLTS